MNNDKAEFSFTKTAYWMNASKNSVNHISSENTIFVTTLHKLVQACMMTPNMLLLLTLTRMITAGTL